MKAVVVTLGVIGLLLGGLWLLQGLGIATIPPILCVAECEALEGPSPAWAAIGLAVAVAGALAIYYALQRRRDPRP